MSHTRQEQMEAFGRFLDILDELRVKCPWDRKQTNESLRPNTIEETYELCDALMRDDKKDICKELGDVLLHVAFYAKIGSETGDFDIKDVCDKLCDKLIFRHPHVFGEVKAETAGQVSENWEQLKLKEKDGNKSVLSGVPAALPSLIKAIMSHTRQEQMEAFGRFLDILDELRVKCPWDRKQTNESLRPNTIEETYELCDALMRDDKKDICKELGDVLLHVAFYAKIGSETGDFDIKDVCDKLCDKLIFRHPHVFGEVKAETAGQVSENWEQLKLKEKDGNKSVLSGVPAALPSLIKAYRIQDKARNVGFDWEEREQVWDKVKEEIGEFQEEVANMDKDKAEAEFGDVMFSLINAARLYKINPDNALERTNQKFIRRFNYLEEHTIKEGKNLKDMSLEEMDAIWNEAKKKGL